MSALGLVGLSLGLLLLRKSILLVLIAGGLYAHFVWGAGDPSFFVQDMWAAIDKETILALPVFIMVGELMSRGAVARRLIAVMEEVTRPLPGGLGVATVASCAVFAAISGSSIVTLMAVGAVMYPALRERNYSRGFALGSLASAGTLGMLIPPSVPMILYGIATETSISDLFMAGVGPGLLITGVLSGYAMITHWHLPRSNWRPRELALAIKNGIWSLMLPVILLGGIYSGYFSPTEAASVALLYCVLIEFFIHRGLTFSVLRDAVLSSAKLVGMLFPLIAVAISLNLLATEHQLPKLILDATLGFVQSPVAFILSVNLLLLVIGCFIDPASAILVLGPLLAPMAVSYGFDPVLFGVIMIINLEIGFLTPPVGMNLIVAATAFNEPFSAVVKAVIPFILMMIACLLLITFVPSIAMWLVR